MKRILFVDDDDLLLEIYKVLLSGEEGRWEVSTASGGAAALKLMEARSFDVIATDMHMPGMNGAELLNAVVKRYSQTSRIMISGVSDQAEVARALGFTHQFIAKPVELDALQAMLARLEGLDAFLNNEKLKSLAGQLRVLPSFPRLYFEIMKAIEAPETPLDTIDDLILQDPALTTKILQIANSAALGMPEKIQDPRDAIRQLGLNTVRSLALSAHVFASFTPAQKLNFPMETLWGHLLACGDTARLIMQLEDATPSEMEAAYTAGILHDIGKLMLADSLPDEFQTALMQAATRPEPFHVIEQEIFGATHAGLAAYLLGLWGLPATIVEAVAFHHTPEKSTHGKFSPLTAVHVANALEHEMDGGNGNVNEEYLASLGVATKLEVWREKIINARTDGDL